jgi:SNF2 family DNA or RNA helicase
VGDVLVESWRNNTNVILADEMGLGKTVQSVAMLGFLQVCLSNLSIGTLFCCYSQLQHIEKHAWGIKVYVGTCLH